MQSSRKKLFEVPTFLDHEMIYYNTLQNEFYVFDKEATWDEKGLSHPALQISKNFDEKKWLDAVRIV
jgi:hypothetical protein